MTKQWWIKFESGAYIRDTRCLSPYTRGVWMDFLCLMFESPRRGHLLSSNGHPHTLESLARFVGCTTDEITRSIRELRESGVADSNGEDQTYLISRRMVRDDKLLKKQQADGRRGGNPLLVKGTVKGVDNLTLTLTPNSDSSAGKGGAGGRDSTPDLPEDLRELADCWRRWLDYRKEIRKPVKPRSAAQAFADFRRWGVVATRAAIDASIRNGWQGLFEPKIGGNGSAVVDYAGERIASAEKRRNDQLARVNAMLQEEQ